MQNAFPSAATLARWEKKPTTTTAVFLPLESLTQPTVSTEQASFYLNRRPQTMRGWACLENGPIRPVRVHGRLAWPVADIRRLLEVA